MSTFELMGIGLVAAVVVGMLLGVLTWPTPENSFARQWFRDRLRDRRLKLTRL